MSFSKVPVAISWSQEKDDEGGPYWLGKHPLGDFVVWDNGVTRPAFAVEGLGHGGYTPPSFPSLHEAQKACWNSLRAPAAPGTV